MSKAYNLYSNALNPPEPISDDRIKENLPILYPLKPNPTELYEQTTITPIQTVNFKTTDIKRMILQSNKFTSPPSSGISYEFLQKVAGNELVLTALKNLYDSLLNNPIQSTKAIPELFEFSAMFIPKDNGGLRPLAN